MTDVTPNTQVDPDAKAPDADQAAAPVASQVPETAPAGGDAPVDTTATQPPADSVAPADQDPAPAVAPVAAAPSVADTASAPVAPVVTETPTAPDTAPVVTPSAEAPATPPAVASSADTTQTPAPPDATPAAAPVVQPDAPAPVVAQPGTYVPPASTDLSGAATVSATVPNAEAASPTTPAPSGDVLNPSTISGQQDPTSFELGQNVIGATKMTNAKGTAATVIIVDRINRHMDYLAGKLAFASKPARDEEMATFIETIGNTLRLPYEQYVLVTNQLLTAIKNNLSVFENGLAFRFMVDLARKYPQEHLTTYRVYIDFLTKIASNWSARSRLDKKVDIASVIAKFPAKVMKENATRYYREIVAQ